MNAVFVAVFITGAMILFRLIGGGYFHLTKDEINNEKLIKEYLEQKYNEMYPKNQMIEIDRPKKRNGSWTIHIKNDPSNVSFLKETLTDIGLTGGEGESFKIVVTFLKGSSKKIIEEVIFNSLVYRAPYDDYRFVSKKEWDEDGNEIEE